MYISISNITNIVYGPLSRACNEAWNRPILEYRVHKGNRSHGETYQLAEEGPRWFSFQSKAESSMRQRNHADSSS